MARILVIEDEENLRFSIRRALDRAGHDVAEAGRVDDAWQQLQAADFDCIVTDVNLDGDDGVELVGRARGEGFQGAVVVMTAFGTVESAVRAMKNGADDYLQKPLSLEALVLLVDRLLERRRMHSRLRLYQRMERQEARGEGIVGESDAWRRTIALAERVAKAPIPERGEQRPGGALPAILLLGETGAGKGVLARRIHAVATDGADAPFVHVNCSAMPPQLVESELFGHEKGAFTDAKASREGLFEMADGGTIFLDEIGDMPLDLQAKLLTVVEQGTFRRVGGSKDKSVRARVVAATNQDLEQRVEAGTFRRDLLYRLNTFTVHIPPLRERGEDSVLLARAMLERFGREYGRPELSLSDEALTAIGRHDWPGNVRELINDIQRAVMLTDGEQIEPSDLTLAIGGTGKARALPAASNNGELRFDFEHGTHIADEVEKTLIVQALEYSKGNVSKAARLIGMQRSSFRYRIERYKLDELVQEIAAR